MPYNLNTKLSVPGYAIDGDDMHWTVNCPHCEKEIEYQGFFDATDKNECTKCGTEFYTNKLWINDNEYIQ